MEPTVRTHYLTPWPPRRSRLEPTTRPKEMDFDVEGELAAALSLALERRETSSYIVGHSSRVAKLACSIAELVELRTSEMDALRMASQLHEIGMIGVPSDLLLRPSRLTPVELQRVRSQASIGAEIVKSTHGTTAARLIERQYTDYAELRRSTVDSRELLLAGILRVADVFDAMVDPRPYQEPVPEERWRQVLRVGSGSRFHPAAVYAILHLIRSPAYH